MHDYKTVMNSRRCWIEPSWEWKINICKFDFFSSPNIHKYFWNSNIFKLYWSDIFGFDIRFSKWKKIQFCLTSKVNWLSSFLHRNALAHFNWIKFLNHISISRNLCNLCGNRLFSRLHIKTHQHEAHGQFVVFSFDCQVLFLIESAYYSYLIKSWDIFYLCKYNGFFRAEPSPS